MKITLSPSSLSLFQDCPRCFWLDKVKNIKRPSGPFPSLPSGMDRVLKEHFDRHREKKSLPEALKEFSGVLYPDHEKLEVWRNAFKGLQYSPNPTTVFRGALDDLFLTPKGQYVPIDFKTRGYPRKENTHEHYQLQMDCYALLLEKNALPPASFAILIFYHPLKVNREHQVEFHADPLKLPTHPASANRVFREAIACLQGKEPGCSKECGYCNWKGR